MQFSFLKPDKGMMMAYRQIQKRLEPPGKNVKK
jgi:hypothetical protein